MEGHPSYRDHRGERYQYIGAVLFRILCESEVEFLPLSSSENFQVLLGSCSCGNTSVVSYFIDNTLNKSSFLPKHSHFTPQAAHPRNLCLR